MNTEDRKISACVICYNEENKIRRCLESLTWCDEIVVVDSFSTDRTVEICKEYTERVYQHEWLGYIGQKNLIRDMAHYNWILFLDADEEVSDELRNEIQKEFSKDNKHFDSYAGYEFPRIVFYLGRWIRHGEWYPDIKLRLFRKELGRSAGQEPHDQVIVKGSVKRLKGHLLHYTYDNIYDHVNTINRFSSISAKEKAMRNSKCRISDIMFRPALRFFKGYILRQGFMDGMHGLLIAMISAFGVRVKYAKLWELELLAKHPERLQTLADEKKQSDINT